MFGAIGDAIGSAANAVADTVSDVAGGAADVVSDVASGVGHAVDDVIETVDNNLGPIGDVVDGAMDVLSSGSLGSMLNTGLDKLGLPDWVGDVGGGVLDFCTGNMVGAAANGLDALEDVAKACGGDELAGYLKAGSNITGMFAGGPGAIGGKAGQFIDTAQDSLGMVNDGLDVAQKFGDGDILGAGKGLLDLTGTDLGSLEAVFDSDIVDGAKAALDQVAPHAGLVMDTVGGALADGKLDSNDLQRLPMAEIATKCGVDPGMLAGFEEAAGPVVDFLAEANDRAGQLDPADFQSGMLEPAIGLNSGIMDAVQQAVQAVADGAQTGADPIGSDGLSSVADAIADAVADKPTGLFENISDALGAHQENVEGTLSVCLGNPDAGGILSDLLEETTSLQADIDITHHHTAALRG